MKSNLFNKYKEGKGVERDAPPDPPIKMYFSILLRKFWYFVRLNILYVLLSLPVTYASYYAASVLLQRLEFPNEEFANAVNLAVTIFFIIIPVVAFGPIQAGMTRILRDFSQEKQAFIWYDFYQTMKKNFKQSLIVSLINFVAIVIIAVDLAYYSSMAFNPYVDAIVYGFVMFVFVIFLIMQFYIYPMLITFKLSIKQLYKNAFLMAMAKFIPNFALVSIDAIAIYGLFLLSMSPIIGTLCYFVFLPAILGFANIFYSFRVIKKYMIDAPANPDK